MFMPGSEASVVGNLARTVFMRSGSALKIDLSWKACLVVKMINETKII